MMMSVVSSGDIYTSWNKLSEQPYSLVGIKENRYTDKNLYYVL